MHKGFSTKKYSFQISVSEFKYGDFSSLETYYFDSVKLFDEWFEERVEHTTRLEKESSECGESLSKWTGVFFYKEKKI